MKIILGGSPKKADKKTISQKKKITSIVAFLLFVTITASGSLFGMKLTLAKEVFVNGNSVGIVKDNETYENVAKEVSKELTDNGLSDDVKTEAKFVVRVVSEDEISTEPELKQEVMANCEDTVEGCSVYADDKLLFTAIDEQEAKKVIEDFKNQYIIEDMFDVEGEIVQKIEYKNEFVPVSNIKTVEASLEYVNCGNQQDTDYIVQEGDTIESIAKEFKMDEEILSMLNNFVEEINPGDILKVKEINPIINYRFSYKIHNVKVIPYENEEVEDESMIKGSVVVVKEGTDGEKKVLESVVSVNDVIESSETLEEEITKEPIKGKLKIGTNNGPNGEKGCFAWPSKGVISSRFGLRSRDNHKGLDIAAPMGTPIYASAPGVVTYSSTMSGYGNIVIIKHANGYQTYYGHCSELLVPVGTKVNQGTLIAKVGSTGISTGPHVHFEVRYNGIAKDPELFLK